MFAELGARILTVDLDPQANLTAAFLDEEQLADIWENKTTVATVFDSVKPLMDVGDFDPVAYRCIEPKLALIPGDLALSGFEDMLSATWTQAMGDDSKARSLRILSVFWRLAQQAATRFEADLVVIDIGPNLGAINRAALLASNYVIIPLGADLFSLQGLHNLGPTLQKWRKEWTERRESWESPKFDLPKGDMQPAGYIAMRHGVRLTRPVKAYTRWLDRVPAEFRSSVLGETAQTQLPTIDKDNYCLAMLKDYNSLMPLAQESRKPIFALRPADGAIGAHSHAVQSAYADFKALAQEIAKRIGLALPVKS